MTHFPNHHLKHSASPTVRAFTAVRQAFNRDILWGRPVFKAPTLASPQVMLNPLPFTAVRITQRSPQR